MLTMTVEIPIVVMNEEQAMKILAAVDSGMAEAILKNAILYDLESPVGKRDENPVVPRTHEPVQMVATKKKGFTPVVDAEPAKRERPKGIMGRDRFNRKG